MNNKIRLLSHRSFGLHSAEALISLVYLNCGGLTLERIHSGEAFFLAIDFLCWLYV